MKKFKNVLKVALSCFLSATLLIANVQAATLKAPTLKSVAPKSSTSVSIKWQKVNGAKGYEVYQKKGSAGYKKVATIKGGTKVSYTKKKLDSATKYSFKIKALKNDKKSAYSKIKSTYTLPSTPKLISVKAASTTTMNIKWQKVSKADGYVLYQKSGSTNKKIATIKSGKTTAYTISNLESGQKYTFAIKAYFAPQSKKLYSAISKSKTGKTATENAAEHSTEWIPTKGGTKYHCTSSCSNMIDPKKVSINEAEDLGFGPCGRCYK